jgi:hypothetical protein
VAILALLVLPALASAKAGEAPEEVYEIVIQAPRVTKESVQVTVSADETSRVPGTQGDALKVVQDLPGVARSAFSSGQLVVWGSAPKDTRVYLDGVELPALYHLGGLRSVLCADLVRDIALVPGGYGAEFGRGLGGLVRLDTRTLPDAGVHGFVAADVLDASAMVTAAIGDRLRLAVAGRQSYLDRILAGVVAPDVGDFFPIPRYRDLQAKATWLLRADEALTGLFLASNDALRRTVSSTDPAQVRTERQSATFYRAIVTYRRLLPEGGDIRVTPSFGFDQSQLSTSSGAVPTKLDVSTTRVGLRASSRQRLHRLLSMTVGLDGQVSDAHVTRQGSMTLPPREGDISVFGLPPGGDVNADSWQALLLDVAPFVAGEVRLGPVTVTPGLRLDAFGIGASRLTPRVGATPGIGSSRLEWGIDPRLQVAWQAKPRVRLTASAGLYHQAPEPEDLSSVFGTPTLGLSRAAHYTAGGAVKVTSTLTAELVGFYKRFDDLVQRSPLPTPALAQALVQDGTGRSYGGQILIRQELWRGFFGWVSYALGRSERKLPADPNYRLFDYDQTHVLGVVASYELRGWVFGARFRYATGMPRTPVIGAFYDSRGDQYQPVFGPHNSIRVGDFFQLDLRVERGFRIWRTRLTAYLDVQNVTARKNPEELTYSYDFTRRGTITGLPTLAVVGARLVF